MIHSKKESRRRRSHRQLQDFERRRRGGRNREIRLELPRGEPEGQEPQRRVAATPSAHHAHGKALLASLLLHVHVGVPARDRELRRCHAPPGAGRQQSTGSRHQQAIGWRRPTCERLVEHGRADRRAQLSFVLYSHGFSHGYSLDMPNAEALQHVHVHVTVEV